MKIQFKNIATHIHQGRREYQEDSFATGTDFILVSDGVGGLAKGNVASDIVARTWSDALQQKKIQFVSLEDDVQTIVDDTLHDLLQFTIENPDSYGMGATLACAAAIEGALVSIHIGDSRVYHFRENGELAWRSKDHSLVQELIDTEVIKEEDAATHPRRNVITRVLQAKKGHKAKASMHLFENVKDGDLILVCSDGVNEAWSDESLASALMCKLDTETAISVIGKHCSEQSNDNNTAVLAQVNMFAHQSSKQTDFEQTLRDFKTLESTATTGAGSLHASSPARSAQSLDSEIEISTAHHSKTIARYTNNKIIWKPVLIVIFLAIVAAFYFLRPSGLDWTNSNHKVDHNKPANQAPQNFKSINENHTQITSQNGEPTITEAGSNITHIESDFKSKITKPAQIPSQSSEDSLRIDEELLIKTFRNEKNNINAKSYLIKYPKGKYSFEIQEWINAQSKRLKPYYN